MCNTCGLFITEPTSACGKGIEIISFELCKIESKHLLASYKNKGENLEEFIKNLTYISNYNDPIVTNTSHNVDILRKIEERADRLRGRKAIF